MNKKETLWLSHPNWDKPRKLPKEKALNLLKNQKMPNVPHKYRNAYKLADSPDEKKQLKTDDQENSSNTGADKEADKKTKKRSSD